MSIIDFNRPLILATASEARRALVSATGLKFIPDIVDVDETSLPGEDIKGYVERLARAKAEASVPPSLDAVIVAVDTAIGIDGEILGKPSDEMHAREMLSKLSGREHIVASAIAVRDVQEAAIETEVTRTVVKFAALTDHMIEWYIGTGEWKKRAGAYAIQGKGAAFIEEIRGCFTNVIGISIPTLIKMLSGK